MQQIATFCNTYPEALRANIKRNRIKKKLSLLFAVILSVENKIVLISLP